jgi:hypothetical protein
MSFSKGYTVFGELTVPSDTDAPHNYAAVFVPRALAIPSVCSSFLLLGPGLWVVGGSSLFFIITELKRTDDNFMQSTRE